MKRKLYLLCLALVATFCAKAQGNDTVQLPYTANFTQGWTTSGGATIIDNNHASINVPGQEITSPWIETTGGRLNYYLSVACNSTVSNSAVWVSVETENGTQLDYRSLTLRDSSLTLSAAFNVPSGLFRFVIHHEGNQILQTLQLSDLDIFMSPVTMAIENPAFAHIGDTVTFTAHATVQQGFSANSIVWWVHSDSWNWVGESAFSTVAMTDSIFSVVFHIPGVYHISAHIDIENVYNGHTAQTSASTDITLTQLFDCDSITLPYTADFTQCWTAEGGAAIIDPNHASINAPGQTLTSPWFEAPQGICYLNFEIIRDYGENYWHNWEDSSAIFHVHIEAEYGNQSSWGRNACESRTRFGESFHSDGGRYRLVFNFNQQANPVYLMHVTNLTVKHYPWSLTMNGPDAADIGDTVTITASLTMPTGDSIDGSSFDIQLQWNWIEESKNSFTIIASTDTSRTVVLHTVGDWQFKFNAYRHTYDSYYYISGTKIVTVLDTVTRNCDNLILPYTADFTQCWSAENGATIIDPTHAAITAQNQRLVGPWMESVAGKTFLSWRSSCDDNCGGENNSYTVTVEDETGVVLYNNRIFSENNWWGLSFTSLGGRIRIVFERPGSGNCPSFQISDVHVYQYQIDLTFIAPGMAHVGDTVTITAHATLQNSDTPDRYYLHMIDPNGNEMEDDNPLGTILSRTDSSITMIFNATGRYRVDCTISKYNVYRGFTATTRTHMYINIVDHSFYEEDSIYYTSVAKDTVIGCHPMLHSANLPESVRVINDFAFLFLSNLSNVNMPDGLTHIGKRAFALDYNITEVTIPRGVQFIGDSAFWRNSALAVVNFNAENCTVMGSTNGNTIYPVFIGCDNLRTIHFGESVKTIPDHGFAHCYGLRDTILIPDSVTTIGRSAFYQNIETWNEGACLVVILGRSVHEIGEWAFYQHNYKLKAVVSRNPEPPIIYSNTFWLNPDTTTLTVPCGTTETYRGAYYWYEFSNIIEDCTGIDEPVADDICVYAIDGCIVVEGARGESVRVFDVMGRQLLKMSTSQQDNLTTKSLPTGVYMVRVGIHPARKVVVVK